MKKIKIDDKFQIECKRLYLPVEIKCKCPNCDKELIFDLDDDYLSYPELNEIEYLTTYCSECDDHYQIEVVLRMQIEYNPESIQ